MKDQKITGVPGSPSATTCLWRIDTAAVKRSDPRNALQLSTRTLDDFIRDFCRRRPDTAASESLRNQAAIGV
jgi:hypothetical protein